MAISLTSGALKLTPDPLLLPSPKGVPEAMFLEAWLLPTESPVPSFLGKFDVAPLSATFFKGMMSNRPAEAGPTDIGLNVNASAAPAATKALSDSRLAAGTWSCRKKEIAAISQKPLSPQPDHVNGISSQNYPQIVNLIDIHKGL